MTCSTRLHFDMVKIVTRQRMYGLLRLVLKRYFEPEKKNKLLCKFNKHYRVVRVVYVMS